MELAESAVERRLTDAECESFLSEACPADVEIPASLPLRGGLGSYGATDPGPRALAGTTVTMAASASLVDDGFARELEAFTERTGIDDRPGRRETRTSSITTGDLDAPTSGFR